MSGALVARRVFKNIIREIFERKILGEAQLTSLKTSLSVVLMSNSNYVARGKPKFLCFHVLKLLLDKILGSTQTMLMNLPYFCKCLFGNNFKLT